APGENPRRAGLIVEAGAIKRAPDDGEVAVGRQANRSTLTCLRPEGAGSDQLAALLGPLAPAAREDPHRSRAIVVLRPANDDGVAVARQRARATLVDVGVCNCVVAHQLGLLRPRSVAAGEHPRCADLIVVD